MIWPNQWSVTVQFIALILCQHLVITLFQLINLFSSHLAEASADGFYIILSDSPDVMSDTSVCNTRVSCSIFVVYLVDIM